MTYWLRNRRKSVEISIFRFFRLFQALWDHFREKNLFHDEKYTEVIESMKNSLIKWQEINEDSFRFV